MQKKLLRKSVMEKLAQLSKPFYEDKSYLIANRLFDEPDWNQADVIGITVSNHPEVDTYQIIRKGWELGKRMVVPKCDPKQRTMAFRWLERFSQLESVYYGLYEPIEQETKEVEKEAIDLLIVPGLAFTKTGARLGFGGGYYDRYLSGYQGATLSLAFHEQIVAGLPVEDHDRAVSKVITDQEVITAYG